MSSLTITRPDSVTAISRRRPSARRASAKALLFLLPGAVMVGGLIYFSVGYTFWLSTLKWDGLSPTINFVGFANYIRAFGDPIFWATLRHSAIYCLVIAFQMALGLIIAVLLRSGLKGSSLFKVIFFVPTILAPAIMAPVFRELYAANGSLNGVLEAIGLGFLRQHWLASPDLALYTLVAIGVWSATGFAFILYYASLGQIDHSIYEAARLDGASDWRVLFSIIIPMMKATHVTLLILGVMGVLKTFDTVLLVTGGGPARSTEFLSTYIYEKTIAAFDAGYGAALSVFLLGLSLAFTVWQMRRYRKSSEA